jgi:hypothetical protein
MRSLPQQSHVLAILVLGLTAFFVQSGDMPPVPVAKQTEEFALKARREGQLGPEEVLPRRSSRLNPTS